MNEIALDALRVRILKVFPAQVRKSVEPLTDEQFWWRPNESSNSIANIVIHLTGSLNHFLNRDFGGLQYQRDREGEFKTRDGAPKGEVMAAFDAMVANAETTFASISPARLAEPSTEPKLNRYVFEDLLNIAVHLANHAGQIVWIVKSMQEGLVDEVWIKTHRTEGAWV
ncbi:MAG TPA: DinB family protein [Thermoanaerobaculia bacterium]|nr:DinB family protein [Thermoanaerobaculia bacterium]